MMLKSLSKICAIALVLSANAHAQNKKNTLVLKEGLLPKGRHQLELNNANALTLLKEHDIKLNSAECLKSYKNIQLKKTQTLAFEFWVDHLGLNCYRNLANKKLGTDHLIFILDKLANKNKVYALNPHVETLKAQLMFVLEATFLAQPTSQKQKQIILRANKLKSWFADSEWAKYLLFSAQVAPKLIEPKPTQPEVLETKPEPAKEQEALNAVTAEQDKLKKLKLTKDFLIDYPNSFKSEDLINDAAKAFINLVGLGNISEEERKLYIHILSLADSSAVLARMNFLFYRGRTLDAISLGAAAIDIASDKYKTTEVRDNIELQTARLEQFVGDFSTAIPRLKRVANGNGSLKYEARFSLGLIEMRRQNFDDAVEHFSVIHRETKDTALTGMALNYLYHLYDQRKIEGKKNAVKSIVLTDYGLTYAGLRILLMQPKDTAILPWIDQKQEIEVVWPASEMQLQAFARFKELIKYGWFKEAQQELKLLPQPLTPEEQIVIGALEVAAHDYRSAIRRYTDVWSKDITLRTKERLQLIYPKLFWNHIQKYSAAHGIDPFLVLALMRQESSFDRTAISVSDARGLMQLLVPSGAETATLLRVKVANMKGELFDPELNIRFGTHYLRRMLRMFGDNVPLALSAYNAGPGRIRRWLEVRNFGTDFFNGNFPIPIDDLWVDELPWNETRFYSKAILRNWLIYKMLYTVDDLRDLHPVWKKAVLSTN